MPANLYQRNGIWWGRATVAGVEHRRSLRTSNRAEAARRLEQWKTDITAATHFGESRLIWQAAVLRYVETVMPEAVKPGTAKRYLVSFRQVGRFLADRYVDQITRKVLADMVSVRQREGASNATINRDLTAISNVLGSAVEWGACESNPAHDFNRRLLTRERRDPITPPSDDDVAKMMAECATMFAAAVRFLAETGCRQEEACSLEWRWIDLKRGEVTFPKTKTSRPRTIRLAPQTVAMLSALPRTLASSVVFWHGSGERYTQFSSRFWAACKKAGVRFRCHDLRHRYAITELRAGRDIYDLSRHLGHTSVKTTEIYLGYVAGRGTAESAQESAQRHDGQ